MIHWVWNIDRWLMQGLLTSILTGVGFLVISFTIEYVKRFRKGRQAREQEIFLQRVLCGEQVLEWNDGKVRTKGKKVSPVHSRSIPRGRLLFEQYKQSGGFLGVGQGYYSRQAEARRRAIEMHDKSMAANVSRTSWCGGPANKTSTAIGSSTSVDEQLSSLEWDAGQKESNVPSYLSPSSGMTIVSTHNSNNVATTGGMRTSGKNDIGWIHLWSTQDEQNKKCEASKHEDLITQPEDIYKRALREHPQLAPYLDKDALEQASEKEKQVVKSMAGKKKRTVYGIPSPLTSPKDRENSPDRPKVRLGAKAQKQADTIFTKFNRESIAKSSTSTASVRSKRSITPYPKQYNQNPVLRNSRLKAKVTESEVSIKRGLKSKPYINRSEAEGDVKTKNKSPDNAIKPSTSKRSVSSRGTRNTTSSTSLVSLPPTTRRSQSIQSLPKNVKSKTSKVKRAKTPDSAVAATRRRSRSPERTPSRRKPKGISSSELITEHTSSADEDTNTWPATSPKSASSVAHGVRYDIIVQRQASPASENVENSVSSCSAEYKITSIEGKLTYQYANRPADVQKTASQRRNFEKESREAISSGISGYIRKLVFGEVSGGPDGFSQSSEPLTESAPPSTNKSALIEPHDWAQYNTQKSSAEDITQSPPRSSAEQTVVSNAQTAVPNPLKMLLYGENSRIQTFDEINISSSICKPVSKDLSVPVGVEDTYCSIIKENYETSSSVTRKDISTTSASPQIFSKIPGSNKVSIKKTKDAPSNSKGKKNAKKKPISTSPVSKIRKSSHVASTKASPRVSQKASPNVSPKASPKSSPKSSPKETPKASQKSLQGSKNNKITKLSNTSHDHHAKRAGVFSLIKPASNHTSPEGKLNRNRTTIQNGGKDQEHSLQKRYNRFARSRSCSVFKKKIETPEQHAKDNTESINSDKTNLNAMKKRVSRMKKQDHLPVLKITRESTKSEISCKEGTTDSLKKKTVNNQSKCIADQNASRSDADSNKLIDKNTSEPEKKEEQLKYSKKVTKIRRLSPTSYQQSIKAQEDDAAHKLMLKQKRENRRVAKKMLNNYNIEVKKEEVLGAMVSLVTYHPKQTVETSLKNPQVENQSENCRYESNTTIPDTNFKETLIVTKSTCNDIGASINPTDNVCELDGEAFAKEDTFGDVKDAENADESHSTPSNSNMDASSSMNCSSVEFDTDSESELTYTSKYGRYSLRLHDIDKTTKQFDKYKTMMGASAHKKNNQHDSDLQISTCQQQQSTFQKDLKSQKSLATDKNQTSQPYRFRPSALDNVVKSLQNKEKDEEQNVSVSIDIPNPSQKPPGSNTTPGENTEPKPLDMHNLKDHLDNPNNARKQCISSANGLTALPKETEKTKPIEQNTNGHEQIISHIQFCQQVENTLAGPPSDGVQNKPTKNKNISETTKIKQNINKSSTKAESPLQLIGERRSISPFKTEKTAIRACKKSIDASGQPECTENHELDQQKHKKISNKVDDSSRSESTVSAGKKITPKSESKHAFGRPLRGVPSSTSTASNKMHQNLFKNIKGRLSPWNPKTAVAVTKSKLENKDVKTSKSPGKKRNKSAKKTTLGEAESPIGHGILSVDRTSLLNAHELSCENVSSDLLATNGGNEGQDFQSNVIFTESERQTASKNNASHPTKQKEPFQESKLCEESNAPLSKPTKTNLQSYSVETDNPPSVLHGAGSLEKEPPVSIPSIGRSPFDKIPKTNFTFGGTKNSQSTSFNSFTFKTNPTFGSTNPFSNPSNHNSSLFSPTSVEAGNAAHIFGSKASFSTNSFRTACLTETKEESGFRKNNDADGETPQIFGSNASFSINSFQNACSPHTKERQPTVKVSNYRLTGDNFTSYRQRNIQQEDD